MCIGPIIRHFERSTARPASAACSSITFQWPARFSNPAGLVAATDSRPTPWRPASFGPDGEIEAATAMSNFE